MREDTPPPVSSSGGADELQDHFSQSIINQMGQTQVPVLITAAPVSISVGSKPASPQAPAEHVMGPELIAKIAQVAAAVGFQAGVPALDIAGQMVSILAANPEHIDRFMVEGTELFLDGTFDYENGSLTYRAMNGAILSPSVLREKKGQQQ